MAQTEVKFRTKYVTKLAREAHTTFSVDTGIKRTAQWFTHDLHLTFRLLSGFIHLKVGQICNFLPFFTPKPIIYHIGGVFKKKYVTNMKM